MADPMLNQQLTLPSLTQNGNSCLHIPSKQGILESRHVVASLLCDSLHHAKSLLIAGGHVQERKFVELLGLLVRRFDNLERLAFFRAYFKSEPGCRFEPGESLGKD